MAKEITFYNDFREGWLAYILGEDYDSKQSDSWKEGWDTAMETKIYDETRDVVYGCIRKGRIIISNLPDSPALEKAKVVQDSDSHWYVIPAELEQAFESDNCNDEMADSGEFAEKYDQYRTNGDINNIQLYAEFKQLTL